MRRRNAVIASRDGGEFACYLVAPETGAAVPAIVLASTVHGVDADLRAIADEFASQGYIAAAPDLFWRPSQAPAASRLAQIKSGEGDMTDTLAHLRTLAAFNGRAAVMGFCYGGPYAIVGPKRLGYAAGISCHGTGMLDHVEELDGVEEPVCILWGDRDHLAPVEVVEAYRGIALRKKNVEVRIFPGVLHGYMMRGRPAFDVQARDFSMARAGAILGRLRGGHPGRAYEVERRAGHVERPGFRIAELQISPVQTVPWHYHSVVRDTFYVLAGTLRICLRDPEEEVLLEPGETYTVRACRPHLVANAGQTSATFLVLQGIGEHDFVSLA